MRQFADGLLAGIDQVGVFLAFEREGADAEHAVFALQRDRDVFGNVVSHQGRDADAEVDVEAILQLLRHPGGHLVAAPAFSDVIMLGHQPISVLRVVRNSIFLS